MKLGLATMILVLFLITLVPANGLESQQSQTQTYRLGFYYPWFPKNWNQLGIYPYTNYHPSLGFYNSSDATVIRAHVAEMQYANIQGAIVSWWGQGSYEDNNFARILALSDQGGPTDFEWMLYYELEGIGNPSVSQISSDLSYIKANYASSSQYFKINGKFVVFVYADASDGCGMADRWKQANSVGAYVVLKVFPGYRSCASQPDGWHQYAPALAEDSQAPFSFTISPGFWKVGENPRLARDITRWRQNIYDMIASHALFQVITTFNEWGEGTAVESASEWSTVSGHGEYLDALHLNGQQNVPEFPVTYPILLVPLVLSLMLMRGRRFDRSSRAMTETESILKY